MLTITLASFKLRPVSIKTQFEGSKSISQLKAAWQKVGQSYSLQFGETVDPAKLQGKYDKLKMTYTKTRSAESQTGNDSLVYPPAWEIMLNWFGNVKGIGDIEYSTQVQEQENMVPILISLY